MAGIIPEWTQRDRIVKARSVSGFKQSELSEQLGMSRATLASIEQGVREPRRGELIAIAFATGVDLKWLETGKTPERDPVGDAIEGDPDNWWANRDSNPEPAGLVSLGA